MHVISINKWCGIFMTPRPAVWQILLCVWQWQAVKPKLIYFVLWLPAFRCCYNIVLWLTQHETHTIFDNGSLASYFDFCTSVRGVFVGEWSGSDAAHGLDVMGILHVWRWLWQVSSEMLEVSTYVYLNFGQNFVSSSRRRKGGVWGAYLQNLVPQIPITVCFYQE